MVHYDPSHKAAHTPPPSCPKCGSHRTEVIGSTEVPPAIMLRCNACSERSAIPIDQDRDAIRKDDVASNGVDLEIEVIQAVGRALEQLPGPGAQRRVLRWLNDCYQPWQWVDDRAVPQSTGKADAHRNVDGLADAFDVPGLSLIKH